MIAKNLLNIGIISDGISEQIFASPAKLNSDQIVHLCIIVIFVSNASKIAEKVRVNVLIIVI